MFDKGGMFDTVFVGVLKVWLTICVLFIVAIIRSDDNDEK